MNYVLAVSGGVDSMVLLHKMARRLSASNFVVAHADHGIRPDSKEDRLLVEATCHRMQIPFYYTELKLGADASEEVARKARYDFLFHIMSEVGAEQIVTAHHHDDLLETAIFNLFRGTGRRGVTPFMSRPEIARPLRQKTKEELLVYAKKNNVEWREDSTNSDSSYSRNRLRNDVIPYIKQTFPDEWPRFNKILTKISNLNIDIDFELQKLLSGLLQKTADSKEAFIEQAGFAGLPAEVAQELLLLFARLKRPHFVSDRRRIMAASEQIKTAPAGKIIELGSKTAIQIRKVGGKRCLFVFDQA